MALLIVINCTFIGIKNNIFCFGSINSCVMRCVIFSGATWTSCLLFFFLDPPLLDPYGYQVINEHRDCYLKADNTLLKIIIRGLLIEKLEVLSVPRMR